MKFGVFQILTLSLAFPLLADEVATLHLTPAPNMERADLYYTTPVGSPRAVLILAPGCNGSGETFLRSPPWQEFARRNKLGLVGLSFASPEKAIHDGTGYYYASKGSGAKLLEGIRKIYGQDLPLLLYGFSGGAHFTSRFEEWKPSRVLAWCAYSAGWWDLPQHHSANPPGIIACGDQDPRYGATLSYFKQGRAAEKPWLWVSLPKIGHQGSPALDQFVREYFSARLAGSPIFFSSSDLISTALQGGIWADVDTKQTISNAEAEAQPSESAWLPARQCPATITNGPSQS
jgi:pimeloyl-ACP methyl ester carboxylesterase